MTTFSFIKYSKRNTSQMSEAQRSEFMCVCVLVCVGEVVSRYSIHIDEELKKTHNFVIAPVLFLYKIEALSFNLKFYLQNVMHIDTDILFSNLPVFLVYIFSDETIVSMALEIIRGR